MALLPHEDVVFIPHVSLQAILVLDSPDVDLRLWNATVAEMEASGKYLVFLPGAGAPPLHPPSLIPMLGGLRFRRHGFLDLETDKELFFSFMLCLGVLGGM